MGLIREPKNVDFYVIDVQWTEKEKKELSAFIKLRKEQHKKGKKQLTLLAGTQINRQTSR